jgi:hypothetical protein
MELNKKANWRQNPTRKNVILYTIVLSISSLLMLLSITDFFSENPFQKKNITMFMLLMPGIWGWINIVSNYNRNK